MLGQIKALARDRRGGTAIEYGLICAMIVVTMVVTLQVVAGTTVGMWGNVANKIQGL